MNKNSVILAACLLVLPCSAVAGYVGVGDKAPAFQATTIDGQKVILDNPQSETPLFLVFWATWCPFCEEAIPRLKEIYSKYGPKDMTFLAINPGVHDSLRKTQLYVEKYHIPYPVVYDEGGVISKSFGINGVPTIIIVDKNDIVRHRDGIPDNIDEAIRSATPELRAARLSRQVIPSVKFSAGKGAPPQRAQGSQTNSFSLLFLAYEAWHMRGRDMWKSYLGA